MRPVTIYSMQYGDMPFETFCKTMKEFGYDGIELGICGDHFDLSKLSDEYVAEKKAILAKYGLSLYTISQHLTGQCIADKIDFRHQSILADYVWGDGDPDGVRQRAAQEVIKTGLAAKMLGCDTVIGFTGSPIWAYLYSFPPVSQEVIDNGYKEFAELMLPILDEYQKMGVRYALEVHPTEIAFDIASAERTLETLNYHPAFGFNFDPSHFAYQGVDYVQFIYKFADRIFRVHMKDVWVSDRPAQAGVFGGHIPFGDYRRYWNFASMGRGSVNFRDIMRALNYIGYNGPLSVEWEDNNMDRLHGAKESCAYVKALDHPVSKIAFDSDFGKK